ncbi:MAG: metal-dependent transcriptional regulator [Myxococcota bacterium]|nr:metal-dependent transcriptional regulator [Myxococcota bacterium]
MNMNDHRENVLEAVLMVSEIGEATIAEIKAAQSEDVQIEVTEEDIAFLVSQGFLVREADKIALTEKGNDIARQTLRRHRLAEMLLFSLLGVDRTLASEIGCRIEHGIREEMLDGVCTLLGHPSNCPHGRPIPPGRCCAARQTVVESQIIPLSTLRPGERARIVYIQPRSHARLHRLTSLGLNPGVEVRLHRRKPAFCLQFEGTELAIDPGVAADIQVCRIPVS